MDFDVIRCDKNFQNYDSFGDMKADIVAGMLIGGVQDGTHNAILGEILFDA
jgi:hypothetical protein